VLQLAQVSSQPEYLLQGSARCPLATGLGERALPTAPRTRCPRRVTDRSPPRSAHVRVPSRELGQSPWLRRSMAARASWVP